MNVADGYTQTYTNPEQIIERGWTFYDEAGNRRTVMGEGKAVDPDGNEYTVVELQLEPFIRHRFMACKEQKLVVYAR